MIPRDYSFDATRALLSQGYPFIARRCHQLGSDAFHTRLLLKKVTCATGEDAAAMFYHPDRFTRKKAMPPTAFKLLQDLGSVQMKDGASHRHRKQLFMSLLNSEQVEEVVTIFERQWHTALAEWQAQPSVVFHDAMREVLCATACQWLNLTLSRDALQARTREISAMIDNAGRAGPHNWRAQAQRHRSERWARGIIQRVRDGDLEPADDSPLHNVAHFTDSDGQRLEVKVAAVELLNLVRPIVAVGRFITFAALALHQNPSCAARLADEDDGYREQFVQEVRRYYPFFPCIGGRVREPFSWRGERFGCGQWVLLDIYGTNHDPRIWQEPDRFRPERFEKWNGGPFTLISQGGGGYHDGHRCPGERLTIELVKKAAQMLVRDVDYTVPKQDLSVDLARMPAKPADGLVIAEVRRRQSNA